MYRTYHFHLKVMVTKKDHVDTLHDVVTWSPTQLYVFVLQLKQYVFIKPFTYIYIPPPCAVQVVYLILLLIQGNVKVDFP